MSTHLSYTQRTRALGLWALAGLLATASVVLPRLFRLNEHFASGFFTAEAFGMIIGLLLSGIIMGAADPQRAARWGVVVGLAPLVETAIRMSHQGLGTLWPIAIFLALMLGVPAAAVGTLIGKRLRRRQPAALLVPGGLTALLMVLVQTSGGGVRGRGTDPYWGFTALAPPPAQDTAIVGGRGENLLASACYVTGAIPNLPEIAGTTTVARVEWSFGGTHWARGNAEPHESQAVPSTLTLLRVPGTDSVELRITAPVRLTFHGTVTSANEASGRWRCIDGVTGSPDSTLGLDGEWVLRRGSWPTEKLAWPVIRK